METMTSIGTIQADVFERIKDDSEKARLYLNEGFNAYHRDKKIEPLLLVMRTLVEAKGGLDLIAKKAEVDRDGLAQVLAGKRDPDFVDMAAILRGSGYYFSLVKKKNPSE